MTLALGVAAHTHTHSHTHTHTHTHTRTHTSKQVNGWKVATTVNMSVIFLIFGVTLDSSELFEALKAWKALAFGLVSMLFLTPLLGFAAAALPFEPREFALGLAVMACVPSSLSSGVTLVIQVRLRPVFP